MEEKLLTTRSFDHKNFTVKTFQQQEHFVSHVYKEDQRVFISYPYDSAEKAEKAAKDYYIQLNKA